MSATVIEVIINNNKIVIIIINKVTVLSAMDKEWPGKHTSTRTLSITASTLASSQASVFLVPAMAFTI